MIDSSFAESLFLNYSDTLLEKSFDFEFHEYQCKGALLTMKWTTLKRYFTQLRHAGVLLGMLLVTMPLAASTVRIYVVNSAGTTIDVIDPATNKVVDARGRVA